MSVAGTKNFDQPPHESNRTHLVFSTSGLLLGSRAPLVYIDKHYNIQVTTTAYMGHGPFGRMRTTYLLLVCQYILYRLYHIQKKVLKSKPATLVSSKLRHIFLYTSSQSPLF